MGSLGVWLHATGVCVIGRIGVAIGHEMDEMDTAQGRYLMEIDLSFYIRHWHRPRV
jgi:hypothetical protein